jgi:hypothetical protein
MSPTRQKLLLFAVALLLSFIPLVIFAGECKEHIELHSADYLAKEYGKSEMWVLNNVKINLWEKPTHLGKGRKVGQMLPGSRALILETSEEDYRVKSPLDKSIGWINKIQVKKTLFQDTVTRKSCSPKGK